MIAFLAAFMSRLSKRGKTIFYGVLAVVSLLLLYGLVLRPILTAMDSLDERIHNEKTAAVTALRILNRREELKEKLETYKRYFRKPPLDDKIFRALHKHIDEMADESSVTLIKTRTRNMEMEVETRLKRYPVSVECEAKMEQIAEFFYKIEGSDELLKIEKFNITAPKEGSSIVDCEMVISQTIIL